MSVPQCSRGEEQTGHVLCKDERVHTNTHLKLGTIPSELSMPESHVASNENTEENKEMQQVVKAHTESLNKHGSAGMSFGCIDESEKLHRCHESVKRG